MQILSQEGQLRDTADTVNMHPAWPGVWSQHPNPNQQVSLWIPIQVLNVVLSLEKKKGGGNNKKKKTSRVWRYMPVIQHLGRLRQENMS